VAADLPNEERRPAVQDDSAITGNRPVRDKSALRAQARAVRREVDPRGLPAVADALAAAVEGLPAVRAAGTVAAYLSIGREPPTTALLDRWRARGLPVLLPVVLPDLDLDWALDDGTRRPGVLRRVAEPASARLGPDAVARADVLVVPALAVDRAGRRLGQGGGSFDRALARARPDALVVALLHDVEVRDAPLPVEPHDRPVDVVVTPSRVLVVRRA
jgi:5-formyltetrahydrofolate cyclo-ligase